MLGLRSDSPTMTQESPPGLLLIFTIDTEGSIVRQRHPDPERVVDELILGDYGTGERGGIRLHMDLLERFGFRGCFFVDVLMEYQFGREALSGRSTRSPPGATRYSSISTTSISPGRAIRPFNPSRAGCFARTPTTFAASWR